MFNCDRCRLWASGRSGVVVPSPREDAELLQELLEVVIEERWPSEELLSRTRYRIAQLEREEIEQLPEEKP